MPELHKMTLSVVRGLFSHSNREIYTDSSMNARQRLQKGHQVPYNFCKRNKSTGLPVNKIIYWDVGRTLPFQRPLITQPERFFENQSQATSKEKRVK
jgi:hypothetical protein